MKNYLLIPCMVVISLTTLANNLDRTEIVNRFQSVDTAITELSSKVDSNTATVRDLSKKKKATSEKNKPVQACTKKVCIGTWEWILIFSPTLLVLFLLIYVKRILTAGNYPISEALQEVTIVPTSETTKDEQGNATTTTSSEINRGKSSSRLVLFLSGIAALLLAAAICAYYFYFSLTEGEPPEIESLSNVLLALGIGVAPYAVNKVSKAIKS